MRGKSLGMINLQSSIGAPDRFPRSFFISLLAGFRDPLKPDVLDLGVMTLLFVFLLLCHKMSPPPFFLFWCP